jgi:hypothetical protein
MSFNRPICQRCGEKPCEMSHRASHGIIYRAVCWRCRSRTQPNYNLRCKRYQSKMKLLVLDAYGHSCECCGEKEILFLTVDHINGGGRKHTQEIGGRGHNLYRWLVKHNFPQGFRILCFNCNCGRAANKGICPHKQGVA